MFHEIIKHSRKIKDKLEESKKSSSERWKEIITELLIIIFAVSLTTWFHDLNEHRNQQKEVNEFLVDLKDDLNKDIEGLENQKGKLFQIMKNFKYVRNLDKKRSDSLDNVNPKYQVNSDFRMFWGEENNGNYESFESSGKIVFIENKKLKKLILSYYKQYIPAARKTGESFVLTLGKVDDYIIKNIIVEQKSNTIFLASSFQTDLEINVKNANENVRVGDSGIKKAKDIIAEINQELR